MHPSKGVAENDAHGVAPILCPPPKSYSLVYPKPGRKVAQAQKSGHSEKSDDLFFGIIQTGKPLHPDAKHRNTRSLSLLVY